MAPNPVPPGLDASIAAFYRAFDNREGRIPTHADLAALFLDGATILRHAEGRTTLMTLDGFIAPRVALLSSGRLTGFSEHEVASSTRVVGPFATRVSDYEKSGTMDGAPYGGRGTKLFHLADLGQGWRIVSLSWVDL